MPKVGSTLAAIDPKGNVASVASAEDRRPLSDLIDQKVSLPRVQKSAMLPIVTRRCRSAGQPLQRERHAKFPLLGLAASRKTYGNPLMQGRSRSTKAAATPATPRCFDLQQNEERLISYAIDLGTREGRGERARRTHS